MPRFRLVFLAAVFAVPVAGLGCGTSDNKPNPELKAPEVPPGGRGAGPAGQPKDVKAKK